MTIYSYAELYVVLRQSDQTHFVFHTLCQVIAQGTIYYWCQHTLSSAASMKVGDTQGGGNKVVY